MIKLRKILVGVDFSDHSRVAVAYAAEFAKMFNADVILCHVAQRPDLISQLPPGGEGYFPPNIAQLEQDTARTECTKLLAEFAISRGSIATPIGTPFVELVRMAKDEQADLLVIGTHGRGAVAHMLLGSVAEKVVRKAPCPVLTVRQGEHEFIMP